jgi:hypothetical protein
VEDFKIINQELASFTGSAANNGSGPFSNGGFLSGHDFKACPERSRMGADRHSDWEGALAPAAKEGSPPESDPEHPLAHITMIICATKIDSANPEKLKKLAAHVKRRKLEFHAISAVTGQGIEELKWALARRLRPTQEAK